MSRRAYNVDIVVNSREVKKILIDLHYEEKHKSSVNDEVILQLVRLLDGGIFPVQDRSAPFEYFVTDHLKLDGKFYKLVWLLEDDQIYIGIVNAYRRKKK